MKNDTVAIIKDKLDIVEVVGDRVRLQKRGNRWLGLCPFHNEKTPSFHVSQERQSFYCFGCKKGGDIFNFVMETEGFSFSEALEFLANRAGVEVEKYQGGGNAPKVNKNSAHEILELANSFFRQGMVSQEGTVARAYLARRDFPKEANERFELGWSPGAWDGLAKFLKDKNVSEPDLIELGLAIDGTHGAYDRFRARVMFPIRDISGRLIAFGGRLIDGDGAKYMNSPESAIYSKRRNLYLLNLAKSAIKEKNRSILVEGYIDAIRLHLCGYPEAVGSLGTALTEEQATLLKRFSDRCYICYDSDKAGQDATLRGMFVLQKMGLDVHVVSLPRGKDPDALLSEGDSGADAFEQALTDARPLVLQLLHASLAVLETSRKGGEEFLFDGLLQLEDSDISPFANKLAGALNLSAAQFWQALDKNRRTKRLPRPRQPEPQPEDFLEENFDDDVPIEPIEAALCAILWHDEETRENSLPADVLSLVSDDRIKQIAFAILNDSPQNLEARWHSVGETLPMRVIAQGADFCECLSCEGGEKWDVIIASLSRKKSKTRYDALRKQMRLGTASSDEISEMNALAVILKK